MNFFGTQQKTRRASYLILTVFVASLAAMALVIQITIGGLAWMVGASDHLFQQQTPIIVFTVFVWLSVLLGAVFCWMDISGGGAVVARRLGAFELRTDTRVSKEKELRRIVIEMAIASHCEQPEIFLLRAEHSINSFVVGSFDGDIALVVSEGALRKLDRDELQAVVAHEFGHIANKDVPTNMRMLLAMRGMLALDEIGQFLKGSEYFPGYLLVPGLVVGLFFRTLGVTGVFFSGLLRSAFSRRREYLADASAVQFARQSEPLARALHKVWMSDEDKVPVHSHYAGEVAHLCIHSGNTTSWFDRFTSSHPPLESRIRAIDPQLFDRLKYERAHSSPQQSEKDLPASKRTSFVMTSSGEIDFNSGGNKKAAVASAVVSATVAAAVHSSITETANTADKNQTWKVLLIEPSASAAALFALFCPAGDKRQKSFLQSVEYAFSKDFADRVKRLTLEIKNQLSRHPVEVADYCVQNLRANVPAKNISDMLLNLEAVLKTEALYDLMNFSAMQYLSQQLRIEASENGSDAESAANAASQHNAKSFESMGKEFALLLSLIVESTGAKGDELEAQYQTALRCYTREDHPRTTARAPDVIDELESAFLLLTQQPRTVREGFVEHCAVIVARDGVVNVVERTLIQLFAASLSCSIPDVCEPILGIGGKAA